MNNILAMLALMAMPVSGDEPPPATRPTPSVFELTEKAKEFLKDEHPMPIFKLVKGKNILIGKEALRVTLRPDGTFRLVRIDLLFTNSKNLKDSRGRPVKHIVGSVEPEECAAQKRSGGGLNADYQITCEDREEIAFASKDLDSKGREIKTFDGKSEAVYVPYSDALATPEVIEKGDIYFRNRISEAADGLRADGIYSHANPKKLVADMFEEKTFFALGSIEHIDPDEDEEKGPKYSGNKVLTQFGLNSSDTFQYSISPGAGALCLMQIMPSTYGTKRFKGIRDDYPEAKLPSSAREGACSSHVSAIRVAYLVLDSKLARMSRTSPEFGELFSKDPETYGIYLATAYNGGEKKGAALFEKTVNTPGFRLNEFIGDIFNKFKPQKGKISKEERLRIANEKKDLRVLRKETWIYIKKYFEIMKEEKK